MKNFDIISFEELERILNAIPDNSIISVCDEWEEGVDDLHSYQVEDWYGIKKVTLFDAMYDAIIIGWWGGGNEVLIPLDDDFVDNFSAYVNDFMDGTTIKDKICMDMNDYRKAVENI